MVDCHEKSIKEILNKDFHKHSILKKTSSIITVKAENKNGEVYLIKFVCTPSETKRASDLNKDLKKLINKECLRWSETELAVASKGLIMTRRKFYKAVLEDFLLSLRNHEGLRVSNNAFMTVQAIFSNLFNLVRSLHRKNISHGNIHARNIAFDWDSFELTLLDWESYALERRVSSLEDRQTSETKNGFQRDMEGLCEILIGFWNGLCLDEEAIRLQIKVENYENIMEALRKSQKSFAAEVEYIKSKCLEMLQLLKDRSFDLDKLLDKKKCTGFCQNEAKEHLDQYLHNKCKYGSLCQLFFHDFDHRLKFWHPTVCQNSKACSDYSSDHLKNYVHCKKECIYRGFCTLFDEEHLKYFVHPPRCKKGDSCEDYSEAHIENFTHANKHCSDPMSCRMGSQGKEFIAHLRNYIHKFLPPCKNLKGCDALDDEHFDRFSHLCKSGSLCKNYVPEHTRLFIHIEKLDCKASSDCDWMCDEEHLETYNHSFESLPDCFESDSEPALLSTRQSFCRLPCPKGNFCTDRSKQHMSQFAHAKTLPISNVYGKNAGVDFEENASALKKKLDGYIALNKIQVLKPVLNYCENLRPQHRCSLDTFRWILKHGYLLSLGEQERLKTYNEKQVIEGVIGRPELKRIKGNCPDSELKKVVAARNEYNFERSLGQGAEGLEKYEAISKEIERKYKLDLNGLEILVGEVTKNIENHKKKGLQSGADKENGTSEHVFSIIGDNFGELYGEIVLVMKQEIMHHPDFFMTPVAAKFLEKQNKIQNRPWDSAEGPKGRDASLNESKLNAVTDYWPEIIANKLGCKVFEKHKKKLIDLKAVSDFWSKTDPHLLFEGLLPPRVNLGMVETILMDKETYDKIKNDEEVMSLLSMYTKEMLNIKLKILESEGDPRKFKIKIAEERLGTYEEMHQREGFCFSIFDKTGIDTELPVKIKNSSKFKISMEVMGDDFHLNISSISGGCVRSGCDDYYKFIVNFKKSYDWEETDQISYKILLIQGRKVLKKDRVPFLKANFDSHLANSLKNKPEFIKWVVKVEEVLVDQKRKQRVTFGIKIDEVSTDGNLMPFARKDWKKHYSVYETEAVKRDLQYVTVSCWDNLVSVRNFKIKI